ncbi:hypothetical protein RZO50_04855 [Microbacterium sp. SSW1-59]|uniref:glycosyltransferase n=1 Tax=Microbacterium xanthum TaxID=3079794 RepID=UPI002AD33ECE|nr:nucleotide disphospho-sugar-binding domain-containing protein [Microbacterium sp. SSW1-59]MDZ8200828.1 hypothetical protein [Microbacterium sp. SSW1-59]
MCSPRCRGIWRGSTCPTGSNGSDRSSRTSTPRSRRWSTNSPATTPRSSTSPSEARPTGASPSPSRALGTLPVNVVAPIRHYLQPDDTVPANIHVTDLLPAHRLGGLVDAAVIHGGQGTVQTACATGVPFVGMGLQPEQTWHVRACAARGNAIALSPKDAGAPGFLDAVRRVLTDPGIRQAADEVREAYEGADGAAATARLIEATLAA